MGQAVLLFAKYERSAFMGQIALLVAPRYTLTPHLNESVFDCFRSNWSICGLALLSTVTSLSDKWQAESYGLSAGIVNSLTHKNLKKARQHISQNVVLSYDGVSSELYQIIYQLLCTRTTYRVSTSSL